MQGVMIHESYSRSVPIISVCCVRDSTNKLQLRIQKMSPNVLKKMTCAKVLDASTLQSKLKDDQTPSSRLKIAFKLFNNAAVSS